MCKKIKTKNNKGFNPIKRLFGIDGLPSFEESVEAYQQYLRARSDETLQSEPLNKLSLDLKNYLQLFNPVDLIIAINVLELWLPNIAASFKFSLLLNTLLSIPEEQFLSQKSLNSYQDFASFSQKLIQLFPEFPMYEDYIPEIDFGEVKYQLSGTTYQIFYGCGFDNIADYITAFTTLHGQKREAIEELTLAVSIQDYIIKQLSHSIAMPYHVSSKGHFEVPSLEFWQHCKAAIEGFSNHFPNLPQKYINTLGSKTPYLNSSSFSHAFMSSQINQGLAILIDDCYYPLSIRNNVSVVIEQWAKNQTAYDSLAYNLLDFLGKRLTLINHQPMQLVANGKIYDEIITAVIPCIEKTYLIIGSDGNGNIPKRFEKNFNKALKSEFGFKEIESNRVLSMTYPNGRPLMRNDFEVLYVVNVVSTTMQVHRLPEVGRYFCFIDFVAIFDSIANIEEIDQFFKLLDEYADKISSPVYSFMDMFAFFKQQHGIVEQGAIKYDKFFIDPHTGSNWRFINLCDYWKNLSVSFPNDEYKWLPIGGYEGIQCFTSNDKNLICWSTQINTTAIHFLVDFTTIRQFMQINAQILLFFVEAAADALAQRATIIEKLPIVRQYQTINFICELDESQLITSEFELPKAKGNLTDNLIWQTYDNDLTDLTILLTVNVLATIEESKNSPNSRFQGRLCKALLAIIYQANYLKLDAETIELLEQTYSATKRVEVGVGRRRFDSKASFTLLPEPEHYTLARKALAQIIKAHGYEPNFYELQAAKELMNVVAIDYLNIVQQFLQGFDKHSLLQTLLERYDAFIQQYHSDKHTIVASLDHTVKFDRQTKAYNLQKEFNKQSNNYRFLIERLVAHTSGGDKIPTHEDIQQAVAYATWLLTLYISSDILHHGLDVGGIEISNEYIPKVFYAFMDGEFDQQFGRELAKYQLGITTNEEDNLGSQIASEFLPQINDAFMQDTGFSFTRLLQVHDVLFGWAAVNHTEMENSYSESVETIIDICFSQLLDIDSDNSLQVKAEIREVLIFLILEPTKIFLKPDGVTEESSIFVSEYRKRDHRINIRPLIQVDDKLMWSAGCGYRSFMIWQAKIGEGGLPAEFSWPNVSKVLKTIKKSIENELEVAVHQIFLRYFDKSLCILNFDPRKINKQQNVGDYDVLVYIPQEHTWVMVECKFNQTPFCMKDMKRLREEIFATEKPSHVSRIMKRYDFLQQNHQKFANFFGYPVTSDEPPIIKNLYVAKSINWVHRGYSKDSSIDFIQLDNLDYWIRENLL